MRRIDARAATLLLLAALWLPPTACAEARSDGLQSATGFRVELLYSVPHAEQGSWISMCVDGAGRLIVSDERGSLYRVTPPPLSKASGVASQASRLPETKVERIPVEIGDAQGLLWAFDSLYVVVNSLRMPSGLYRVRDTNGDGELDDAALLRPLDGSGEHGPHAVLLSEDGQSLLVVCGNQTKLTELASSRVPLLFGEDHLLPRMADGNGFMRNVLGPGGAIYRVDPLGEQWELVATGLRNPYDAAVSRHGDLFTFDADMEWDFGTPWYRPTRVCLAVSGAEFGWRNGAGKWPAYYPDSLPAIVDVGPGSPTGVTFGYGAKFPSRYQEALFVADWSYGKLYAVHLEPSGSTYRGTSEEFLSGTPLPLTDVVIRPQDGALYFVTGGRGTQSGLYRVTYAGAESTAPARPNDALAGQRAVRRQLEALHGRQDPSAVDRAWQYLDHPDRYLRFAARVAIEHQTPTSWRERALAERNPQAAIEALLALVRASASDREHHPDAPPVDEPLKAQILDALERIDWAELGDAQRLSLLRVYHVLFSRMGAPDEAARERVLAKFAGIYPTRVREQNAELCQLLVYLKAPRVIGTTLELLDAAPTQEEQIEYLRALRVLDSGWTLQERETYFGWLERASPSPPRRSARGFFRSLQARRSEPGDASRLGGSLAGFMTIIRHDALATLTPAELQALQPALAEPQPPTVAPPRPVVKKWTLDELAQVVDERLTARDYDRGRAVFGQAKCFACHRFAGEGGMQGPDLTGVAGRFSVTDLLSSIVEPSKVVSDQYRATTMRLLDGRVVSGRVSDLGAEELQVSTELLDPAAVESIPRDQIEVIEPSPISMMPEGLLDPFHEEEVLDLVAFLLSRGDRNHPAFE